MLFDDPRYVRETLDLIAQMEHTASIARGAMALCAVIAIGGFGALALALIDGRRSKR